MMWEQKIVLLRHFFSHLLPREQVASASRSIDTQGDLHFLLFLFVSEWILCFSFPKIQLKVSKSQKQNTKFSHTPKTNEILYIFLPQPLKSGWNKK